MSNLPEGDISYRTTVVTKPPPFWSIERAVALATPFFGAISAFATGWVSTHFPGLPHISPSDVTAVEIAGFTGAVAAALKWLHGRQQFVAYTDNAKRMAENVLVEVGELRKGDKTFNDVVAALEAHTGTITAEIERELHSPALINAFVAALEGDYGLGGAVEAHVTKADKPPDDGLHDSAGPITGSS
jgi:hypothetical protein